MWYMLILSTITGAIVGKIDTILSILLIGLIKALRYEAIEFENDESENRQIRMQLYEWMKKHTLFATKKSLGENQVGYGFVLLKERRGFLFIEFIGDENFGLRINGWASKKTYEELHRLIVNDEAKENHQKSISSFFQNLDEKEKDDDQSSQCSTSSSSTETIESTEKKVKISTIYIYVPIGSYKCTRYRKQKFQYVSYYEQESYKKMPSYLQDQYQCIQKILQLMKKKQDKGYPENFSVLLTGPPGSGKSHVAYELASHIPNTKLVTEFSPLEPGDSFWTVLSDMQRDDETDKPKSFILFLINEVDEMIDHLERKEVRFHKDHKTQIRDMTGFLNWLDRVNMLSNVGILFTTNRPLSYFHSRITRKGRMDMVYEFKETIVQALDDEL